MTGPLVHVRTPLLRPTQVKVEVQGDLVVLSIGNSEMKMHYRDALALSQWLRVRGKEAKIAAGDGKHWIISALGTLHNTTPDQYGKTFNIRKP